MQQIVNSDNWSLKQSDAVFSFMYNICTFCLTFFTSLLFSLTEQKLSEAEKKTEKQGAVLSVVLTIFPL